MTSFITKFKHFLWVIAFAIVLFLSSTASAADWWVNATATSNGSGSQSSPFNNLQSALSNVLLAADDTIHIAQGTYKPGTNRGDSFVLSGNNHQIKIIGGYIVGTPWTPTGDPTLTILSGNIDTGGNNDSYTVLKLSNSGMTDSNTIISHLTITGAYNGGSGADGLGGGVKITNGAAPRIHKCKIMANTTGGSLVGKGGGIYSNASSPVFTDCLIEANAASRAGGGIYHTQEGYMRLINCTIQSNICGTFGGGINTDSMDEGTQLQILNCLINDNDAGTFPGGGGGGTPADIEGGGICIG